MIPGEMFIKDGEIELNEGRKTVTLTVANTGDRPIQVGSHYHFFETNPALKFDRKKARGMRLDIAGRHRGALRAGQTREVTLVALAGKRTVYGFRQEVMGQLQTSTLQTSSGQAASLPATVSNTAAFARNHERLASSTALSPACASDQSDLLGAARVLTEEITSCHEMISAKHRCNMAIHAQACRLVITDYLS